MEGAGLCTSVHYKPTDSHSYLLYSSSHPSHVKNSIPYSQFLRLRSLCSDDSDFSLKSEEMCNFFNKRGYPASVVQAGHHRAQQIDRQSATGEFHSLSHFTLTTTQWNQSFLKTSNYFKMIQTQVESFRNTERSYITRLRCSACQSQIPTENQCSLLIGLFTQV